MEADEALGFGNKPMVREAGSRGKLGPNMKRLKSKVGQSKNWNYCVGLYRVYWVCLGRIFLNAVIYKTFSTMSSKRTSSFVQNWRHSGSMAFAHVDA